MRSGGRGAEGEERRERSGGRGAEGEERRERSERETSVSNTPCVSKVSRFCSRSARPAL